MLIINICSVFYDENLLVNIVVSDNLCDYSICMHIEGNTEDDQDRFRESCELKDFTKLDVVIIFKR